MVGTYESGVAPKKPAVAKKVVVPITERPKAVPVPVPKVAPPKAAPKSAAKAAPKPKVSQDEVVRTAPVVAAKKVVVAPKKVVVSDNPQSIARSAVGEVAPKKVVVGTSKATKAPVTESPSVVRVSASVRPGVVKKQPTVAVSQDMIVPGAAARAAAHVGVQPSKGVTTYGKPARSFTPGKTTGIAGEGPAKGAKIGYVPKPGPDAVPEDAALARAWVAVKERADQTYQSVDAMLKGSVHPSVGNMDAGGDFARKRLIDVVPQMSALQVEQALAHEEDLQKSSGNKHFDPALLDALLKRYLTVVGQTNKDYTTTQTQIMRRWADRIDAQVKLVQAEDKKNAAIVAGAEKAYKAGHQIPPDIADTLSTKERTKYLRMVQEASGILKTPEFGKLFDEFSRLNGYDPVQGGAPTGTPARLRGEYQAGYNTYAGTAPTFIARFERMRDAQAQFAGQALAVAYHAADVAKSRQVLVGHGLDPGETPSDKPETVTEWVRDPRTGVEELKTRAATWPETASIRSARVAAAETLARQSQEAAARGLRMKGEAPFGKEDPRAAAISAQLVPIMRQKGWSAEFVGTQGGVEALVGEAMSRYDKRFGLDAKPSGMSYAAWLKKQADAKKTRDAYMVSLYNYMGMSGPPDALGKVFSLPGVAQGSQLLNALWSTAWSAPKALAGLATGGEILTPDITLDKVHFGEGLPQGMNPLEAFARAVAGAPGQLTNAVTARPNTFLGLGVDQSPEARKRVGDERQHLTDAINGAVTRGDLWGFVKAANVYASTPFSPSSGVGNIAAQFLDPTNYVPGLNVLTLGHRALLAMDAAKGVAKLSKPGVFFKAFVALTEPEMRRLSLAEKAFAEAGAKGSDEVAARWLREMVGKTGEERLSTTKKFLEDAGLSPRDVNMPQLMSLAEDSISKSLRQAGYDVVDQTQKADLEKLARQQVYDAQVLSDRKLMEKELMQRPVPTSVGKQTPAQIRAEAAKERATGGGKLHAEVKKIVTADDLGHYRDPQYAPLVEKSGDVPIEKARGFRVKLLGSESEIPVAEASKGVSVAEVAKLKAARAAEGVPSFGRLPGTAWATEMPGMTLTDFEMIEPEVQQAVRQARGDVSGAGLSRYHYRPDMTAAEAEAERKAGQAPTPGGSFHDSPDIQKVIHQVVTAHGYTVSEYARARSVLMPTILKTEAARRMLRDVAGAADVGAAYRQLRHTRALNEAGLRLKHLSHDMYMAGASPQQVVEKFVRDHTYQGERLAGGGLDAFQARTLGDAYREVSGHAVDDASAVAGYLGASVGKRPPMTNQQAFRDWMVAHGEWNPRTGANVAKGEGVWTAEEARKYFDAHYGVVPSWLDEAKMSAGGFFDDPAAHAQQMLESAGFDTAKRDALFRGMTQAERRQAVIDGVGGLLPRVDRAAERAWNAKFWGKRVATPITSKGKVVGYRFTAMPWLMDASELGAYHAKQAFAGLPQARSLLGAEGAGKLQAHYESMMTKVYQELQGLPVGASVTSEMISRWAYGFADAAVADVNSWAKGTPFSVTRKTQVLSLWSTLVRGSVMWTPAFLAINTPDLYLKTLYARFTNRSVLGAATARAREWAVQDIEEGATQFAASTGRKGLAKWRDPLASRELRDTIIGPLEALVEAPATAIGKLETTQKRSFYAAMAEGTYQHYLSIGMEDALAQAAARKFAKDEIDRVFFTMASGSPVYRLLNEMAPFLNYQFRNSVFWTTEVLAHPALARKLMVTNQAIEQLNLKEWAKEHPEDPDGSTMPAYLRNRIRLPGTDYYFDLSILSDAGRGIAILGGKQMTLADHLAKFFRLVSPAPQAIANWALASFAGVGSWKWVSDGTGSGRQRVWVPLGEPWSQDPVTLGSVLWPLDAADLYGKLTADGSFDLGDFFQMSSKLLFYTEMAKPNPITVAQSIYFDLQSRDQGLAAEYLARHPELEAYWKAGGAPREIMVPQALQPWMDGLDPKDQAWYAHNREWRAQVTSDRNGLHALMDGFDAEAAPYVGQPWDPRYKDIQARRRAAISAYYLAHPSLIEADATLKTSSEWAKQQEQWQTDSNFQIYTGIMDQKPFRSDYPDAASYSKAYDEWQHSKDTFLAAHPDVIKALAGRTDEAGRAVSDLHQTWGDIIDYRAKLHEYSVNADLAGLQEAQSLYGTLDYYGKEALTQDTAAVTYEPSDVGKNLLNVLSGRPLVALVPHVAQPPSYFQNQWAKAPPKEKARLVSAAWYSTQMGITVQQASQGGVFSPGAFKAIVQANPRLLQMYDAAHPGKAEEWRRLDAYNVRHTAYTDALKAHNWDEANALFDAWPDWMKQRYWDTTYNMPHVTSSGDIVKWQTLPHTKAIMAADRAYGKAMSDWGKLLDAKNFDKARAFFASLPAAIQKRYWDSHPSAKEYSDSMSAWSKIIATGNWDKANAFFDKLPAWVQNRYYEAHPGKKEARVATATYIAAMKQWIHIGTTQGWAKGQAFFDHLPGWVKARYYAEHPEKRQHAAQTSAYLGYMKHWTGLIGSKQFGAADRFFKSMPAWVRKKYYSGPKGAARKAGAAYRNYMGNWVALIGKDKAKAQTYFDHLPGWVKDRYYNDPKQGAKRRQTRDYIAHLEPWAKLLDAGKFDEARAAFAKMPKWVQDRYYNDPVKGAGRRQTRDYIGVMDTYTSLIGAKSYDAARSFLAKQPKWVLDRYYNDPVKGAERRQAKAYSDAMGGWIALIDKGDSAAADAYFAKLSPAIKQKYFLDHPEAVATQQYIAHMKEWSDLIAAKKFDEADKYFADLPKAEQDRYNAKHPESVATKSYIGHMEDWSKLLDKKDWVGAKAFFDKLPLVERQRYFAKHPEKRGVGDTYQYGGSRSVPSFASSVPKPALTKPVVMLSKPGPVFVAKPAFPNVPAPKTKQSLNYIDLTVLDDYFKLPTAQQGDYLAAHPDLASFLASHTPDDKRIQTAIAGGVSAIDDPWLRRIYKEAHPEVFDPAAKAAARLAGIERKLAAHPELQAEYQRILDEIHFTYAQSLHHHLHAPQAFVEPVHPKRKRRHEVGKSSAVTFTHSRTKGMLLGPPRLPRDRLVTATAGARRIVGAGRVAAPPTPTGSAATLSRRSVL